MDTLQVHSTAADGDCLFESVRQILDHSTTLRLSNRYLRSVVARSIVDVSDEHARNALQFWHTLFSEMQREGTGEYLHEFAFMHPAAGRRWPLSASVVAKISDAMMQRNLYWGEEYALRVLERQMKVRMVVLEVVAGAGVRLHHRLEEVSTNYQPTHFMWLHLQGKHYQPISFRDQWLFSIADAPSELQYLLRVAAANNGWLLKHCV